VRKLFNEHSCCVANLEKRAAAPSTPELNGRVESTSVTWGNYTYLFGGKDVDNDLYINDLWRSVTGSDVWELVMYPTPLFPRGGHSMVVVEDILYIFGGRNETAFMNDFWTFDLLDDTWSQITYDLDSPLPRAFHAAAFGFLVD
jgi:N-acetylneuraminic acid mutarotase